MKKFTAIVHRGEPDEGGFWATCLEVPGANGQGETKEECLGNLKEAIQPLLQTMALLCGIILMMLYSPSTRAADGTAVWTNYFIGNIGDSATAIALDENGNVIVTGYIHINSNNIGYGTVKYSSAGVPLWTNLFNRFNGYESNAYGLAVDGSGNVYVTGNSSAPSSGNDYATTK